MYCYHKTREKSILSTSYLKLICYKMSKLLSCKSWEIKWKLQFGEVNVSQPPQCSSFLSVFTNLFLDASESYIKGLYYSFLTLCFLASSAKDVWLKFQFENEKGSSKKIPMRPLPWVGKRCEAILGYISKIDVK